MHATAFALGIHEDTGSLTYSSTTHRDVEALAACVRLGANQEQLARYLRSPLQRDQRELLGAVDRGAHRARRRGAADRGRGRKRRPLCRRCVLAGVARGRFDRLGRAVPVRRDGGPGAGGRPQPHARAFGRRGRRAVRGRRACRRPHPPWRARRTRRPCWSGCWSEAARVTEEPPRARSGDVAAGSCRRERRAHLGDAGRVPAAGAERHPGLRGRPPDRRRRARGPRPRGAPRAQPRSGEGCDELGSRRDRGRRDARRAARAACDGPRRPARGRGRGTAPVRGQGPDRERPRRGHPRGPAARPARAGGPGAADAGPRGDRSRAGAAPHHRAAARRAARDRRRGGARGGGVPGRRRGARRAAGGAEPRPGRDGGGRRDRPRAAPRP